MNGLVLTMFIFVVVIGIALLIFISLTRRSGRPLDPEKYRSRWLAITQGSNATPESWQFAIMSADKLLDSALKERGVSGATMGERLKNAGPHIRNIDNVWRAHKLRNRIAHDDGVTVTKRQANEALKIFKQALIDLGAL
ncbi:TPA: hypothetical protein DCF80_02925 [Candidatus Saccharibacteria bacterium]|nr:hypothetical protein [Candidatus Saccharibacteria bacterium]HRK41171.1 hypothetical protein [Candidatus Saccharibacteria bacterium]